MKLTPEEFTAVSIYEKQLQAAVRSKYLRNVGRSGLEVLVTIYERITGTHQRVNANCAACILEFLQRIGEIYFAEQAEQQAALRASIARSQQRPDPTTSGPQATTTPRATRGTRGRGRAIISTK